MAKKPVVKADPEKPKSNAMKNLEKNLDDIIAFVNRARADEVHRAGKKLERAIEKETASAPKIDVDRLIRSAEKFGEAKDKWLAFYRPAHRWMAVMLVTFLEGYLEDVLIEMAKKNPQLVKDVRVETRSIFQVSSIEELQDEVRRQWAHNELRPDGPRKWYRALRDRGAKALEQAIMGEIQHLWDTRNLIVHGKGIIDAPYAAKYANRGAKRGDQVAVGSKCLGGWLQRISQFLDWTEEFCISYGGQKQTVAAT